MVRNYLKAWTNYFNFEGRTRRREFWAFNIVNILFAGLYVFLGLYFKFSDNKHIIDIVFGGIGIIVLVPTITSMVRRLHDTSRSGIYLLLVLIPIIGAIILLIFFVQDSSASYNNYGEYPKFKKNVY